MALRAKTRGENVRILSLTRFVKWEMRIQQWAKMFKRKPFTGVVLCAVVFLAFVTVLRLRQESRETKHVEHVDNPTRTFSPVELSWPLPLSSKKTSEKSTVTSTKLKRKPVNEEQLKRIRKIHPLYASITKFL